MYDQLEKPVHLYIKTHRKTGIKYFGRTVENPHDYPGSGAYWTRHLQNYGNDVETQIYGTYTANSELETAARRFSDEHDIAASPVWANLLPEDGGIPGAGWTWNWDHRAQVAAIDRVVAMRLNGDDTGTSEQLLSVRTPPKKDRSLQIALVVFLVGGWIFFKVIG